MNRILVIGYGNTLRGDDGAGVYAAEEIGKRFPAVTALPVHQLTPELAEFISQAEIVIFIDAQIGIREVTQHVIGLNHETDQPRTHFFSPETLVQLSQQLYQRTPLRTVCFGIPAQDFSFSEKLTPQTQEHLQACINMIEMIIAA